MENRAKLNRAETVAWATEVLRRNAQDRAAERLRAQGWVCHEPNRLDREPWLMAWHAEQALRATN